MQVIAIILFAFAVIFIGVDQAKLEMSNSHQNQYRKMSYETAKEFAQFTKGVASYVQSVGLPLPGTIFTVQSLQNVNLLPSDFPLQTPFGQTLVADYVTDPNNSSALDVIVHTTGALSSTLLGKAGLTTYSVNQLQYSVASLAQNQIPNSIPGSTGQFFGIADGSLLSNLGSSSSISLPSVSMSQPEVTEYILSPGQYGYWLISASSYGAGTEWQPLLNWGENGQPYDSAWFYFAQGGVSISSQGFSLTCPSVANNLSNLATNQFIESDDTSYESGYPNLSQSVIFCVPAYKEQVNPINAPIYQQAFNPYFGYNVYWNGSYYGTPKDPTSTLNNFNYVQSSSIVGLNTSLYTTGGFTTVYSPAPQYPDNEASPLATTSRISGTGISISVKNPQGLTNVYQIETDGGAIFTGTGCYENLIDPFTGGYSTYDVWATSNSNQNLCGSQETFWTDWHAVKNSTNLNGIPLSQTYKAYGNNYTLNFNVATPLVN